MRIEIFFLILIGIFGFLSFLILRPYLNYVLFAAILVFISFPLYKKIKSKLKNRYLSALLIIVSMILLIIIPSIYITLELFAQIREISLGIGEIHLENIGKQLSVYGIDITPIKDGINNLGSTISSYLVSNIFLITKATANVVVGVFIMLFTMFFLYLDGEEITLEIKKAIPLSKKYQEYIVKQTYRIMQTMLLGIFLSAVIEGFFGGIGFVLFGLPNAIFWGFVMLVLTMLPIVGPPFIYAPASLYLMFKGNFLAGIGLLIYGIVIINNLDNIIKLKMARTRARVHPLIVLLGVVGGIALMGITGMIVGPLILAILVELIKIYNIVWQKKKIDSYF